MVEGIVYLLLLLGVKVLRDIIVILLGRNIFIVYDYLVKLCLLMEYLIFLFVGLLE